MTNTIIDMVRVPTDEYGCLKYSLDEIKNLFEEYVKTYPEHQVFIMPADITIWEDLDLLALENISNFLNKVIEEKKNG